MTVQKLLTMAERLLRQHVLCDWCLGRQFAFQGYGLTNEMRGRALKILLLMAGTETYQKNQTRGAARLRRLAEQGMFEPAQQFLEKEGITNLEVPHDCDICTGIMDRLDDAANAIIQALQGWEMSSILIGSKISPSIIEREEQLRSEVQIEFGEPLKAELNREIGKRVTDHLDIPVDFTTPDIVAIIQIPTFRTELQVNSLFIYGRYQKLKRGFPQTHWPCRECAGKGCPRCKGTGKMYSESVEELIAPRLIELTQGTGAKFHGAGREDIDARMLGNGRPFVLEIISPRRRKIDLDEATKRINKHTKGKVKVAGLRFANKKVVKGLKASATTSKKVYKAIIHVETPIRREELLILERMTMPFEVKQRTPQRVLHRRANRLRRKRVFEMQVTPMKKQVFELIICCQGGLYVKEFISGDEGRTTPSIAEILNKTTICHQLDVMNVEISEEKLPW
ncbi:MAG: tRNA pseudouridine(54/55) synthase Pus10 [Promethearchaeota archaeon]